MIDKLRHIAQKPSTDLWIAFVSRGWGQLTFFVFFMVAGRLLAPETFGVYALAALSIQLFQALLYAGAYNYIIYTDDYPDVKGETLSIQLIVALVATLGLGLSAGPAERLFGMQGLAALIISFIPALWVFALVSWLEASLLRGKRLSRYYTTIVVSETASAIVGTIALFHGAGVYALVIHRYTQAIIFLLFYLPGSGGIPFPRVRLPVLKRILQYGAGIYGSSGISFVTNYAGDILIGLFLTPTAVAHYRMANRMTAAVTDIAGQPARTIGWSLLSSLQRDRADPGSIWPQLVSAYIAIAGAGLAVLAIIAEPAIAALLGDDWAPAAPIITVLCAIRLFASLEASLAPVFGVYARNTALFVLRLLELFLILTIVAGAARFGPMAAAIAHAPAAIIFASVAIMLLLRYTNVEFVSLRRAIMTASIVVIVTGAGAGGVRLAISKLTENQGIIAFLTASLAAVLWIITLRIIAWKAIFAPILATWKGDGRRADPD